MASDNAKEVAKKVSENLRKGKRVILGKILKEQGYAESTSKSPTMVTETKSYKEAINPIVKRWERERERITKTLESKDLTDEKYKDLIDSLDKITKNIQLLSGGNTENVGVETTGELENIANNAILKYLDGIAGNTTKQ